MGSVEDVHTLLNDKDLGFNIREPLSFILPSASAAAPNVPARKVRNKPVRTIGRGQFDAEKLPVIVPTFDGLSSDFDGFQLGITRKFGTEFKIGETVKVGESLVADPKRSLGISAFYGAPTAFISGSVDTKLFHDAKVYKSFGNGFSILFSSIAKTTGSRPENYVNMNVRYDTDKTKVGVDGKIEEKRQSISVDIARQITDSLAIGLKTAYFFNKDCNVAVGFKHVTPLSTPQGLANIYKYRFRINRKLREFKEDEKDIDPEFIHLLQGYTFEPSTILTAKAFVESVTKKQFGSLIICQTHRFSQKYALSSALKIFSKNQLPIESEFKAGYCFTTHDTQITGCVTNLTIIDSMIKTKFNDAIGLSLSSHVDMNQEVYEFGFGISLDS